MKFRYNDKELKVLALKNGIMLGVIIWLLGLLLSYMMFSSSSFFIVVIIIPTLISFLIPVITALLLTIDLRKKIGGYWEFRRAVSGIFIMFLTAFILTTTLQKAYIKFVEPDLTIKVVDAVINATKNMMDKQGVDKDVIEKKIEKSKEDMVNKSNVGTIKTLQGYLINLIFLFVFALFFALIFKRSNPNPFADQKDLNFG